MARPSLPNPHVHLGLAPLFFLMVQFLIIWIPIKLLAARYQDRFGIAKAVLNVM